MKKSLCTVCTERVAENCMKEEELPCLIETQVDTGLSQLELHPSQEGFFLGGKNADVSFIFSLGKSGYSARVTSLSTKAEATTSSNLALDPLKDAISLRAKTFQSREVEGNVTSIILNCQAQ